MTCSHSTLQEVFPIHQWPHAWLPQNLSFIHSNIHGFLIVLHDEHSSTPPFGQSDSWPIQCNVKSCSPVQFSLNVQSHITVCHCTLCVVHDEGLYRQLLVPLVFLAFYMLRQSIRPSAWHPVCTHWLFCRHVLMVMIICSLSALKIPLFGCLTQRVGDALLFSWKLLCMPLYLHVGPPQYVVKTRYLI